MVNDVSKYANKDIIARLKYINPEDTQCFVYPLFEKKGNRWELLKTEDFGFYRNIRVNFADKRIKAGKFFDEMGEIVNIRINGKSQSSADNHLLLKNDTQKGIEYCFMSYLPALGERVSQIWIERFKEGANFYQILQSKMRFENLKQASHFVSNSEIYTSDILIRCEDDSDVYGPFLYTEKEDGIDVYADALFDNYINAYEIDETYDITDEHNNILYSLVLKNDIKNAKPTRKIDWLDDEEMLENLADILRVCQYQDDDKIDFLKDLANVQTNFLTLDRRVRLNGILDKLSDNRKYVNSLFQVVLNDKNMLQQFLQKVNKDDKLFKENIYTEQLSQENDKLSIENEKLNNEIKELKDQLTKQQAHVHDEETEEKLISLTEKNKELLSKLKIQDEYEKIVEQKDIAESEYNDYKNKLDQVKEAIEESVKNLSNEANIIAQQVNAELLHKVLNKVSSTEYNTETINHFDDNTLTDLEADKIIDRVEQYLKDSGRNTTHNDIVNYLTCITQGFITTFAGEPGTGKTSLCGLLGKALGLTMEDNKRMTEVSIERGWTSVKDFIGYYNPLTQRMEKSNSEMFRTLETLSMESGREQTIAPFFVLLDEANLSPIEHYWANFLKFCDEDSGTTRTLNLGGDNNYIIPQHLRFLATVNFDHTTEALSPRFIDRSWIITLQAEENIRPTIDIKTPNTVISYKSLLAAFKNNVNENNENCLKSLNRWKQIKEIFKNNHLPIMPRNQKMVDGYIKSASQYMQTQTTNRYVAADYAISQKILPLINGIGDDYKELIGNLTEECSDLPLTSEHLKRIKRNAERNMEYYQFFAK